MFLDTTFDSYLYTHTHTHTHTTNLTFRKSLSGKSDFTVRANVAYRDVDLQRESGGEAALYEDIDKMVRSVKGKYRLTEHPAAYEFPVSRPVNPLYDIAGGVDTDVEFTKTSQQQHTSTESAM